MRHLGVPDQSLNPSQSSQLTFKTIQIDPHDNFFKEMMSNAIGCLQLLQVAI